MPRGKHGRDRRGARRSGRIIAATARFGASRPGSLRGGFVVLAAVDSCQVQWPHLSQWLKPAFSTEPDVKVG